MSIRYGSIPNIFNIDHSTKKYIGGEFKSPIVCKLCSANMWIATEKMDGEGINIFWDGKSLSIKSRNLCKINGDKKEEFLKSILSEDAFREEFGETPMTVYGEIIGENINKNKHQVDGFKFYVFDIHNGVSFVSHVEMLQICENLRLRPVGYMLGLHMIGLDDIYVRFTEFLQLRRLSGVSSYLEGIVCKPVEPICMMRNIAPFQEAWRVICKIKAEYII